jgi:hypothetical protein
MEINGDLNNYIEPDIEIVGMEMNLQDDGNEIEFIEHLADGNYIVKKYMYSQETLKCHISESIVWSGKGVKQVVSVKEVDADTFDDELTGETDRYMSYMG